MCFGIFLIFNMFLFDKGYSLTMNQHCSISVHKKNFYLSHSPLTFILIFMLILMLFCASDVVLARMAVWSQW